MKRFSIRKKILLALGIAALLFLLSMAALTLAHYWPWRARGEPPARAEPQFIPPPPPPMPVSPALYITFSRESGFYDASFSLELAAPQGAEIFYTLDGSYPGTEAALYDAPIEITALPPGDEHFGAPVSRVRITTVRAVAVMGGEASEIITKNYVMGTDVHMRFCENTLVFALTSDPHGLWDHYEGIMVEGIDREEWRAQFFRRHNRWPTPGYGPNDEKPDSPANFNRRGRESERAVFVEVFDHRGTLLISQRAGLRVRGGFSRADEPQKSLELYARIEYGDRNNFPIAFFPDEFAHDGTLIDRYRRVRLRNGGSDRYAAFIRDELNQSLFRQAGLTTTQTHRPAALFINGAYFGAAWLKTPRTENHLERVYGGDANRFAIVEGGDRRFSEGWWNGDDTDAVRDIRAVHQLARSGFTGTAGEARFEEFSRRICVDDLILYYAMQVYINNIDWPNNNISLWRYFPTPEEENDPHLHPYLRDGRWRVFAHDMDATWGIWDGDDNRARDDTLRDILYGENDARWNSAESSAFLYALAEREDTREKLARAFVTIIDGAFSPENVNRTLDMLIAQFENENNHAMRSNVIVIDNEWWPSPEGIAENRDVIRRFAEIRPQIMRQAVYDNLGFDF